MILDGGPCTVGIESTVLDLTTSPPTILRPGGISRAQIESIIGPVAESALVVSSTAATKSPGQQAIHYAPRAKAFRFNPSDRTRVPANAAIIDLTANSEEYARHFYATLRDLDAKNPPAIYIEFPPDQPQWTAVRDRILRATRPLR